MKYSLVIPCYNEAENIPLLLERCKLLLEDSSIEVILVDNGSTDNTQVIFKQLLPQYPRARTVLVTQNQGYGYGILQGLKVASGDVIGWTHADMQTDPADLFAAKKLFEQQNKSLFVKGRRHGRPLADVFFTFGMSIFESLLMSKPMSDINAQPTLFPRKFFEQWDNPPHDFSLDLYAYYQAHKIGLTVRRIPVYFGKRAHGVSSWNVDWKAKWKFIKRTITYSFSLKRTME